MPSRTAQADQAVNQTRRPIRPSRRLPAVTWALPGTTSVISSSVTARRERIAGLRAPGSRSGWVVGRTDPSDASGHPGPAAGAACSSYS